MSRYKVQKFGRSTNPDEIVTIDTPVGFIQVMGKNLEVKLPESLTAHKGMKRAAQHAKFLSVDGERVYPKWSVLTPITNDDGEIAGAREPGEFVVGAVADEAENSDEN